MLLRNGIMYTGKRYTKIKNNWYARFEIFYIHINLGSNLKNLYAK